MSRTKLLLVLCVLALLVSACGQRGPLFLPDPDPGPATTEEQEEKSEENSES